LDDEFGKKLLHSPIVAFAAHAACFASPPSPAENAAKAASANRLLTANSVVTNARPVSACLVIEHASHLEQMVRFGQIIHEVRANFVK